MTNRPNLLDDSTILNADAGVLNDGGDRPGCALEIHVRQLRNGDKSRHGYFRYNGTPFGEKRPERLPLGSYEELGLTRLRRERAACELLIDQGKSPKRLRSHDQERRKAAGMTLRQAVKEFFVYGHAGPWQSPETKELNDRTRKLHLEPADWIMDLPLESIAAKDLYKLIEPHWKIGGVGTKMRSLLHGTFQYQIDNENYSRSNPASWRKTSTLSRLLGEQFPSTTIPGPLWTEIPHFVAYFRGPLDHWVPGYLTTAQAAYALDREQKAIRTANEADLFPGVIKAPRMWKTASNLYPIPELKKVFGEFVREPIPIERAGARLFARVVLFAIFAPVRIGMVCNLRWRNIVEKKGQALIEYLPKGPGRPSEHKLGWRFNVPYLVIRTDNLNALIEAQREQQIRDGITIEPDGFVFVHERPRYGAGSWKGKRANHRGAEDYLTKAAARLEEVETKKISTHGLRATFVTWAKEHGYSDDLINLSLGHIIPAIRENKTNWHYFYDVILIKQRAAMMKHWEQHCLSLCVEQAPADNVISFPPASSA
jgi:integrase